MVDALVLARFLHFASVVSLAGVLAFLAFIARPAMTASSVPPSQEAAFRGRLMALFWPSAAVAVLTGCLWLVLEACSMSGEPLAEVLADPRVVDTVLMRTQFGHVWLLRAVTASALVVLALVRALRRRGGSSIALDRSMLALSAVLLAAAAAAGHASSGSGAAGVVQLACDALHLLAAGAWLGGLAPLALLFRRAHRSRDFVWLTTARSATLRFSTLGAVGVGTLIATGAINAVFLVGGLQAMLGAAYGRLLSLKIGLFAAMVSVAAVNRLRLTPRLTAAAPDSEVFATALRRLRGNAVLELGAGIAVLALVGVLGVTPPAIHRHQTLSAPARQTPWNRAAFTARSAPTPACAAPRAGGCWKDCFNILLESSQHHFARQMIR